MSLFSSPQSYLGIDFDLHSIKIVELKNEKGKPMLVTYGYFDHDLERKVTDKDENLKKETAQLIKEICKKSRTTSNIAISAIPAFSVFSSVITLPGMSKKELANAIKWEAKKVIPMPLEEMILHWEILDESANTEAKSIEIENIENGGESAKRNFLHISQKKDQNSTKILLTAAPKDLVYKYMEIFKEAGISLRSLDTEPFSLIRSLIGNDNSTIMVVDIDYTVTNISIIQKRIPYLNRSLNVGGLTITRAIANSLNVSLKRAEQFKHDIGIMPDAGTENEIPKLIESIVAPIIDEIKYSLNIFKGQGKEQVEKIILTGGSSLLPNFPDYISKRLNMRVFLGDPWARIIYPVELKPALSEVGPRFSVAIGLAMKEIK